MAEPIDGDPSPGLANVFLHAVYDVAWVTAMVVLGPVLWWRARTDPDLHAWIHERLLLTPVPRGDGTRDAILVHGVSVGEIKAARSLVDRLERERPDLEVVLSTTTSTGAAVARATFPGRRVVRFPADISHIVRRFFDVVQPVAVVLVELEIWPNFLREANRRGAPLVVINGRITQRSFGRYRLFRRLFPQFNRISLFCVQNETYAERFLGLKVAPERVVVTGNVKIDGLPTEREDPGDELRRLLAPTDGRPVVVAGSTHEPEEVWCCEGWRRSAPRSRLVLVPRHPNRATEIAATLAAKGFQVQRLSHLRAGLVPDPDLPALVDTIGELEQVYGLADAAFVGGSLVPHGGQNVLEPAGQGLPVVCGRHTINFRQEIALLLEAGAALEAADPVEAWTQLGALLDDPERSAAMGRAGQVAIASQGGATDHTWRALTSSCLPPPRSHLSVC